jgi:uncharacterized protein (TIRG00374 family)
MSSAAVRQLDELLPDRRALAGSALWAAGNWVLDAASLWVFLAAFGRYLNPVALLVVYGAATLLGSLPVSLGGLGIVEGALVPSLVGLGVPGAAAVLAVVCWRLFEFWLPIPVTGLCYLSLRMQLWRRTEGRDEGSGHTGLPALT